MYICAQKKERNVYHTNIAHNSLDDSNGLRNSVAKGNL